MNNTKANKRGVITLLAISLTSSILFARPARPRQETLEQLKSRLEAQYATIQHLFAIGPANQVFVHRWQDDLAQSFAGAEKIIKEILEQHPPDEEFWRERAATMWLYSQPISPPETRTVFGAGEVQKKARLIVAPPANYPDEARSAKAGGEVRLRLVLASDKTVKYIFPMRPLKHGLTQAAIEAARKISFDPAVRNGAAVSQFLTLSYEFKHGRSLPPYVPKPEFYF